LSCRCSHKTSSNHLQSWLFLQAPYNLSSPNSSCKRREHLFYQLALKFTSTNFAIMGTKGRAVPRVVCCAIPIAREHGKVLVVTSRKRPNNWVCEYYVPYFPPGSSQRLALLANVGVARAWQSALFPNHVYNMTDSSPIFTGNTSYSAKRWLGTVGCAVGGCSLA